VPRLFKRGLASAVSWFLFEYLAESLEFVFKTAALAPATKPAGLATTAAEKQG
jgi:hypothetical protein